MTALDVVLIFVIAALCVVIRDESKMRDYWFKKYIDSLSRRRKQ